LSHFALLASACLLLFSGCAAKPSGPPLHRFEFASPNMGTLFTITLYAPDESAAGTAARAAFERVAELENVMSDYDVDSELMRACARPFGQPVPVSADLFDVLERAQEFSRISDGAFDVTVGPYVRQWRFSRKRKTLPSPEE